MLAKYFDTGISAISGYKSHEIRICLTVTVGTSGTSGTSGTTGTAGTTLLKLLCCFSTRLVIFGTMSQRKTEKNRKRVPNMMLLCVKATQLTVLTV